MKRIDSIFWLVALLVLPAPVLSAETTAIGPVPEPVRRAWKLDPFYAKYMEVGGLPVVSSTNTSDFALLEAGYIVQHMLAGRDDILRTLTERDVKVVVM